MNQSGYKINVSKNGKHLFIACDTLNTVDVAKEAYYEIAKRFPEKEGFKVSVTYWDLKGYEILTPMT